MSALLDPPTVKRDRTDRRAARQTQHRPHGTDGRVYELHRQHERRRDELARKNNGRVAIATLPDDALRAS